MPPPGRRRFRLSGSHIALIATLLLCQWMVAVDGSRNKKSIVGEHRAALKRPVDNVDDDDDDASSVIKHVNEFVANVKGGRAQALLLEKRHNLRLIREVSR